MPSNPPLGSILLLVRLIRLQNMHRQPTLPGPPPRRPRLECMGSHLQLMRPPAQLRAHQKALERVKVASNRFQFRFEQDALSFGFHANISTRSLRQRLSM